MTFDELLDLVIEVTNFDMRTAARVANELYQDDQSYTADGILYTATKLGLLTDAAPAPRNYDEAFADLLAKLHLEPDPAEVLKHVYRECPRMLPKQDGHIGVYPPRIGRAPKESTFYDDWLREVIEDLPENVRLLIGAIDVHHGSLTITMYDEANDVDRHLGPIDLTRYENDTAIHDAIMHLLGRLPRVIASDWN